MIIMKIMNNNINEIIMKMKWKIWKNNERNDENNNEEMK